MADKALPRTIEDVTAAWLTTALQERFPDLTVTDLETVEIIYGTSTKIRMKASYANRPGASGPPEALCVKGGFDERLRISQPFLSGLYELEGNFYRYLAPELNVPLIPCWYAAAEDGQGVVVLDDLIAKGARFSKPVEPWSPERVREALDLLAGLHARTWGVRREDYPWLQTAWDELRAVAEGSLADHMWEAMIERPDSAVMPPAQHDRERMRRALEAMAKRYETGPHCVVHFDATINNSYIDAATGKPRFCDWQCTAIGPFMCDIPYHIAGALTVDDRRKHEKELFAHYLDRLKHEGGPAYTVEEQWDDYRAFEMGMGWLWCTCGLLNQPADTVAVMTERHSTAVADHDTLGALGV